MTFDDRLRQAIERGQERGRVRAGEAQARAMTEEELKRLHSRLQLGLSEQIEACLKHLPNFFPGFRYETVYGERGWGGACSRDDLRLSSGSRGTDYSRLEMTIRPYSSLHVLELTGKGTIRNKEAFNRTYFERLDEVDEEKFHTLIDAWVLEYAELYSARR